MTWASDNGECKISADSGIGEAAVSYWNIRMFQV